MSALEDGRDALELVHKWRQREQAWDTPRALDFERISAALRDLIGEHKRLTAPPAEDECEVQSDENLWDFANDLLDAWNIQDENEPSMIEDFRDRFVARFGQQGQITDAQVEVSAYAMYRQRPVDLSQDGGDDWAILPDSWKGEWRDAARAALEAAWGV